MSVLDVRFPTGISYGAVGGPGYSTDVVVLGSGHEQRNQNWAAARGAYDVARACRTDALRTELIAFFRIAKGRTHSFRFKDFTDFEASSSEGVLASVTGSTYQLRKRYSHAAGSEDRDVVKPVNGTVTVYKAGSIALQESVDYTINYSTGILTVQAGAITLGAGPADATDNNDSNTAAVVLNSVTAGRSLVVAVRWLNATAILSSVSCSGESNLTLHPRAFESGSSRSVQFATLHNVSTGGNKTLTATFSVNSFHKGITAIEAVNAGSTEANANASGNSTNPTLDITTLSANAALFGFVSTNAAAEPDPGAGFTRIVAGQTTGFVEGEYKLDAGIAGSKTVNFSALTGSWALAAIALSRGGVIPVSWAGEFDVHARFDTDRLRLVAEDIEFFRSQSIPIVEVRGT